LIIDENPHGPKPILPPSLMIDDFFAASWLCVKMLLFPFRAGVHGTPYGGEILNANVEIRNKFEGPKIEITKTGPLRLRRREAYLRWGLDSRLSRE